MTSPPEPYALFPRQREATSFGMWIFLASEVIFFGGLFLGYGVYRHLHPEAFLEAARHTDIRFGTANTAILLTSSATMAVAVQAARHGMKRAVLRGLGLTAGLGLAFLVVKAFEYRVDIEEMLIPGHPGFPLHPDATEIFFSFYWAMTALHAVHLTIGVLSVGATFLLVRADRFDWRRGGQLHALGLYWHLIDLIWIFLYPLLYLVGR